MQTQAWWNKMFTAEIKFIIPDLTLLNYTAKVIEKCSSNNRGNQMPASLCCTQWLMQIPETEQKAMTVDLYFKRNGIKERINEGNTAYFF